MLTVILAGSHAQQCILGESLWTLSRIHSYRRSLASPVNHELKLNAKHNLLVLAVKNVGGSAPSKLWVNPPETLVIRAGAAIIVRGDIKNIHEARREAK
jgi:hypothetical protein